MGWALITGASEGLGRDFARLAAAEGLDLVISARRAEVLEALAVELRAGHGVVVVVVPADLSIEGEAEHLWEMASAGRDIDILVNNAGLGAAGSFADRTEWPREYASVMVNVLSATVLMKEAAVAMAARRSGRILNVASVAGFVPGPGMAVYHATKAHLLSLSEAVAAELSVMGVTVTALCPGGTRTGFFRAAGSEGQSLLQRLPMAASDRVAAAGWRGMKAGRRVVIPGVDNKLLAFAPRLVPRRLVAWVTGQIVRRR